MTKKMITFAMVMLVALVSMVGMASATGDILIHPDDATIDVGVSPNSVSPPLAAEFVGWNTSGSTTYSVVLKRTSDGVVQTGCSVSGTITSDPQTVTLPACVIPALDIGVAYHVYASASCPAGLCKGVHRSRDLTVDAPVIPTPESSMGVKMTIGLVGLVGLMRYRRKD